MNLILRVLKPWLPLAAAVTLLSGLIFVSVQQAIRLGANEPQVQMAEDAAAALEAGADPASLLPAGPTDIARSLAPYVIIFDPGGQAVASSAVLNGATPSLPTGVLDYTRQHGENRISYQPEPGVRSATVIVPVNDGQGGYVLAGRSLREAEALIGVVQSLVLLGWAATVGVTLLVTVVLEALVRSKQLQPA